MKELHYTAITKNVAAVSQIQELYDRSFPDDERIPFARLLQSLSSERLLYAWYAGDTFVGMTVTFQDGSLLYLAYLVVEESLRNAGYGSLILQHLQQSHPHSTIVIDIEEVIVGDANFVQCQKRRDFYYRNAFVSTGVFYYFFHVHYELLSWNGIVTAEQYHHLILKHWGPIANHAIYRTKEKGEFQL